MKKHVFKQKQLIPYQIRQNWKPEIKFDKHDIYSNFDSTKSADSEVFAQICKTKRMVDDIYNSL